MKSTLSTAFTLFLIINSLGMAPVILALLKDYAPKQQRLIMLREAIIALLFILVFKYIGEAFFSWLEIGRPSIEVAGGVILFLIALRMIFPHLKANDEMELSKEGPFIVPIAVPLLAGPGTLTTVMIQARSNPDSINMLYAIFIAWICSLLVLLAAPTLKRIIGTRGLNAFERLMGLILTLLAVQMMMHGLTNFYTALYMSAP